ncbi:DUF4406 domain-containing protein [Klebsiella michiganensis]|uniref:DUF4406 domain-containing protein n=1 Tax=Klebsiella michiganensis TaxID=1134687 RepID=UPI0027385348|nr:DUF4406 domain-containing protein [Klebsiella michiganensis]WLP18211.1 DUF4406 domain-containing protein [Klebsiella michiganensis]
MKIYIAGPMTGFPEFNRPAFHDAAAALKSNGHVVLNPATLPDGLSQFEYMDICLVMLRCSNAIYLLQGWESSAGARVEQALAEKLNLRRIYEGPLQ